MNQYKHLSVQERYGIKAMQYEGKTLTEMSKILKRSKGTISIEISRNSDGGIYMPCVAQEKYKSRLHQSELSKMERNPKLQEYIARCMIEYKWSPDAIAGRMKLEGFSETVSTKTIDLFGNKEKPRQIDLISK